MTVDARSAVAIVGAVSAACGGVLPGGSAPVPSMAARCRVGASQSGLIVTEWPAAEKSNLEALLVGGAIAAEFSGCSLRLLPECELPGSYAWQATTPTTDIIEIASEAELYAKLPLGAASLSGELARSGTLYLETTVTGQRRLEQMAADRVPSAPACARATHIVTGMSAGAFVMSAGSEASATAALGARGAEAHRTASSRAKLVRYAGNREQCYGDTAAAPPAGCASPIQLFLSPIPGKAEPAGPPGSVKIDIVSGHADVRWDVYVDDEATCTTPCSPWVAPSRPVALKSRGGGDTLRVSWLDPAAGPIQLVATPTSRGQLATGITFTSLGGLAVVTGVTLLGVGCTDDERPGTCRAGLYSGMLGAAAVAGGIYLMLDSRAKLGVRPIFSAGGAGGLYVGEF